jgi:O-antigen ligase/tetratricopeptide (TPR) repeat protein
VLLRLAAVIMGVCLIGAPLACGAVHRPIIFIVTGLAVALAALTAGLAFRNQAALKPAIAMVFPILFLVITALQIIPLPWGLRARLDPAGTELLALAGLSGPQPFSLDPPATYLRFAEAAAALIVGSAAMVLTASRRLRNAAMALVAVSGVVGLMVGLGHRAAFEDKIYGLFQHSRGLLVGPFINVNHTAELLELAAFAALAFAFGRPSRDGQRIWKVIATVLAAGALSTLSRGAVLALGCGALTWFLLAPKSEEGEPLHRSRFVALILGLVTVVGIALSFGAEGLLDRFSENTPEGEVRFRLWWDALKMLPLHPWGIGVGSFSRVYPVYQSLPVTAWFQFPENQPLGILLETGLPGAVLMLLAWGLILTRFAKNARRDRVEASLAAGLIAVLAHNLTDFGLETLGVLLPFCAVWGTLFARIAEPTETPKPDRRTPILVGVAGLAQVAGIALLCLPTTRDFDTLLHPPIKGDGRALAQQASQAHPTDYFYALAAARLETPDPKDPGNRLRLINRAMILCPKCEAAHVEAARELWRLGRRSQALVEWRTVLALSPLRLTSTFTELDAAGASGSELVSLADERNRETLSRLLLGRGKIAAARDVMASSTQKDTIEFHLVQAQIALDAKDLPAARAASSAALAAAPQDPRAFLMAADVDAREGKRDEAIATLTRGLKSEPTDIELNQRLLSLLMQTDRWRAIDQALANLRRALSEHGAPMFNANLAAAQIFERRGQYYRAVTEYQAALSQHPEHTGIQLALARTAEQAGNITVAVNAYTAVLRGTPEQPEAKAGLARIQTQKKDLELLKYLPSHTP